MATLVTAFYPLEKSKHGVAKYLDWMRNFCQIPRPMVLFTDAHTAPLLERLRRDVAADTRVIAKEFNTYRLTSPTWIEFWERQWRVDPEAGIHNPSLYAVWAIKQECVTLAMEVNPFGHDWYVWCDIGIQRIPEVQSYYMTFPDQIQTICAPGRIHFLEVTQIPDAYVRVRGQVPTPLPPPSVSLGGGCIAGDRAAWTAFSMEYVTMLERFEERGWFAGKDQIVYFTMLMEKVVPFRLFYATSFGTPPPRDIHWMSFPVILGGGAPARVDMRFEETGDSM